MLKILIVEDEENVQDFLINTFKPLGYSTLTAANAAEAMEIFIAEKPQAVFLDIQLPDKSGLDLLKEFKEINQNNIVIIVSSQDDDETQKKALKLGACAFIAKPFFRESIRGALAHNLHLLPLAKHQEKPKILIVDDEEDVCMSLNSYFKKRLDADIVITFDGSQAEDLIKKNTFDVVFMDINLPGKDGLAIIEDTKDACDNTSFIVVTGYLGAELIQQSKKLGVVDYFNKPIAIEDIYKKLTDLLIAKGKFNEK